jgi:hypothetical protein
VLQLSLLTTIPVIPGLKDLYCCNCPLLTSIPEIAGLQELSCCDCSMLTTIPVIPGLQELTCSHCPNLTTIPVIPGLEELYCRDCPILTSIPEISRLQELECWYCPWISHNNPDYERNLQALLTLQRFCRKNLRYWRVKNWVQTVECTEWFYDPRNMGGYKHIQRMAKFLSNMSSSDTK